MSLKNRDRVRLEHFGSSASRQALMAAGLGTFEAIWALETEWVEDPNVRRKGWSGVSQLSLPMGAREEAVVYIKRQQGHCFRDLRHLFSPRPTVYREYLRLLFLKARGTAVPEVIYYGERGRGKQPQAILITREIPHCLTFEEYIRTARGNDPREVDRLIRDTARLIHTLHRYRLQHSALYGKHILIANAGLTRPGNGGFDRQLVPHLIDLEKSRFRLSRNAIAAHDLSQLFRHAPWRGTQWDAFVRYYQEVDGRPTARRHLEDRVAQKVCIKIAKRHSEIPSG